MLVTIQQIVYFLHIKDEYRPIIPILSFFTVYYDYRNYNNSGELAKKSVEISTSYTYGKNNSKYDPDWIAAEFGQQVSDELEQKIGKLLEQSSAQARKILKIVGLIFLVLIVLLMILSVVLITILK